MIIQEEDSSHSPFEPLIAAGLQEVVLTSPDVERLGAFYEDALCYDGAVEDGVWRGQLDGRQLVIRNGKANAIDTAIFSVEDEAQLIGLRQRLEIAGILFDAGGSPDMPGALRFCDPDGNWLIFGVPAPASEGIVRETLAARLQHVVYATDQVSVMLAFYQNVVGFAPTDVVLDSADDVTSVFLRCGEEHHSLAIFRAPTRRMDHICYEVRDWSDIRDWADRLAARHIQLRWGPGRHGPGNNLFFFINDPDGNWLEFSAELELISSPRPPGRWVHEERTLNSWGTAILRS